MARLTGACAGMLAFSIAIFRGLSVGNSVEIILQRAIIALIVFCLIGLILGGMAKRIIVEYALDKEKEIMARFQEDQESAGSTGTGEEAPEEQAGNSTPTDSEPIGA